MKKISAFILTLVTLFWWCDTAWATCDVNESNTLNSLAVRVNASYELMEGILDPDEYTPPDGLIGDEIDEFEATYNYYRIYISNITEDLYVTVYNEVTDEVNTYTYADSDNGTITFDYENLLAITNFVITVYSSDVTNCPNTELYTIYLTTPMFNEYSTYQMCEGNEEFYLCHPFLSVSSVGFEQFVKYLEQYEAGHIDQEGEEIVEPTEEDSNGFIDFITDHLTVIIIVVVVIVLLGGLITFVIIRKQRSKIV